MLHGEEYIWNEIRRAAVLREYKIPKKKPCLMAGRDGIEKTDILNEKYVQKLGELLV